MRRATRLAFSLFALPVAAICVASEALAQSMPAPEFYGQIILPSGLMIGGVEFGGISGLDYDAATGTFLAISDDRAENGPARFYELGLAMAKGQVKVDIEAMHALLGTDGKGFAAKGIDPESIRADGTTRIFWTSENDAAGAPAIYAAKPDGTGATTLPVPDAYIPDAAGTKGVRSNLSFEALALADDNTLVVATENALTQDSDKATLDTGSRSRILVLDRDSGAVKGEYLYLTDPVFAKATGTPALNDNGISEMLSLGQNRFAVMERGFSMGVGNHIAIYTVDLPAPADTTSVATLPADAKPLQKTLWFKIDEGDFGLNVDNVESMTFGPDIDGKRSLIVASDNNFSPYQFTQFVVFTLPK